MMKSATLLAGAAMAALIGALAVTTVAHGATPSTPAEKAATADLNRKLLADTTTKAAQEKAQYEQQVQQQKSQYEQQKQLWERQQEQYELQLKSAKGTP